MAAITNHHKLDGLKQQTFILSPFQRLEVQSQSVAGLRPPPTRDLWFFLFWLLVAPGTPGLVAASLQPLSPSSHGRLLCCSLVRTLVTGFRAQPNP